MARATKAWWREWSLQNWISVMAVLVWLLFTAIEIIRLVLGHGEDLKNENIVVIIGFGLAGWTYIYVVMQETHKRFFGLSETLVGFVLMAVQLYDLPEKLAKPDIGLRITAILGSVGLLAKGMQDLIKSSDIKKKSDPKR